MKAYAVSASRLVDDFDACEQLTKYIKQVDGIWMIDEVEVLFAPREYLMKYQSVMAKEHHKVLNHLMDVIDGLMKTPHRTDEQVTWTVGGSIV